MENTTIIGRHLEAKKIVNDCLTEDQRCRNDDMWLCFSVWKKQGAKIEISFDDFQMIYNPETVIRTRAEIQNKECRLLPTDPRVLIKRQIKEDVLRSYYVNNQTLLTEWEGLKYGVK